MAEPVNKRYWDWIYDSSRDEWRQPEPHIYVSPAYPGYYIVKASDGKTYALPDETGGWCFRRELSGDCCDTSDLQRIEPEQARHIVHRLAGGYTWLWPLVHPYILLD